eukprot:gb/GEZN01010171.1/.p1 GENE.gb/GEZN01010171.1/~~gb/GEZN01010171.1/.p1  ORF type:complete len:101 (-),score=6.44 gb/GEZN01010171.1/:914-1216(-)
MLLVEAEGPVSTLAIKVLSESVRVCARICALCFVVTSALQDIELPWETNGNDEPVLLRRADFVSSPCPQCGRSVSSMTANKVHENSCGSLQELELELDSA